VADTNAAPSVERRRPGRVEYTNQRLIALLRGKRVGDEADTAATGPAKLSAEPPDRSVVLVVLAVMAWALIGLLIWLVLRLL
jgi:hypothetical protein